jgi:hypothetical protein
VNLRLIVAILLSVNALVAIWNLLQFSSQTWSLLDRWQVISLLLGAVQAIILALMAFWLYIDREDIDAVLPSDS